MATRPIRAVLRAYNVGFGDCFLLSFEYQSASTRHVLIDFGTTKRPKAAPADLMVQVARQIQSDCGGKLHVVVATHRHQDHISGFSDKGANGDSGKIIRDCQPDVVLQPWTEDPNIARDARFSPGSLSVRARHARFARRLANLHTVAGAALAASQATHLPKTVRDQLAFLGEDNLANINAVKNLQRMGSAGRAIYARYGTKLKLSKLLPGVRVRVLGPPDLTQSTGIESMRSEDPNEFWNLAARTLGPASGYAAIPSGRKRASVPPQVRWFRRRLDLAQGESLLEIVRSLDQEMNNTSLILLFTVRGKRLLFPGDAQLENWAYALQTCAQKQSNRALLAKVDLYKVGHHGSLNATPKTLLWDNFDKVGPASNSGRLTSVVSTLKGKHGSEDRGTEVPRERLVDTLKAKTNYLTTETAKPAAGKVGVVVHTIPLE